MKTLCISSICYIILLYNFGLQAQNKQIVDSLLLITTNTITPDTTLVKAFNDLGIQYATSNPVLAKQHINKALGIAHKIKKPRAIAGANNCLGVVYYYQKEYDSALFRFKKALAINKEIGHSWGQASALHQIGAVQNHLNHYTEAIENFQKAGEIFKSLPDSISYIKSIENIGVSYSLMKHRKKALEHFLTANKLYEQYNNIEGIGRTYIHISNFLIKQKDFKKALVYLNKSLPIITEAGNKRHLSVILQNIGISQRGLHNYQKALDHFQKSLLLRKEKGNPKTIAIAQYEIGNTYYAMELYSKGLLYQKNALKNYSSTGNYIQKAITYNSIAKSFFKLNLLDSAKSHAEKSISISKKAYDLETEKEANQTLAHIAEKEGNSSDAYMYYKNLSKLKDSLEIIQKNKQATELQAKFEISKKELKITELEKQNQQTKLQNILLILGLGIGNILLGTAIFIFRKKIKLSCLEKTLLNRELDTKKKELTTNSLHLAKKNNVLENLKEEVELIRYSEDQNTQYNYQKVIQIINFDLKDDSSWENFKNHFEQVHKDFYANIKSKYPNVTPNELRLMALLKMNLSSKEIASILNITQEGVRKARYRLRKKLEIPTNNVLMEIILHI
ncbi:tetratricopeptide repeat protein [Aquimarina sp. BL5]|uniref:tetratricopeptide repeat protein n=1 Tax=Aquimarina sp. BL5 TaxID=1714860 RepID=UPI000E4DAC71|nr:tetratricopeptide repeat protein [Aquimarina sp. BL5]AXT53350.1 tetratricopeptide repeat protein [Aquimarina sp. BL5]RKN06189.1 tetratricopeptide repeat protein [Aquimarina sp. BL5]